MTRELERRSRAKNKVRRHRGRPLSDGMPLEMDGGDNATWTFDLTRDDCERIAERSVGGGLGW